VSVTLKRFYVLDQHTMNDDSTIETSTPYCIFVDAADAEERIRTLEAQCKEWERRTWEALDKLHTAIDHKIGARCEHGVWIADHCWECGKKRPAAETSPAQCDHSWVTSNFEAPRCLWCHVEKSAAETREEL
jgi:hypothetical protein